MDAAPKRFGFGVLNIEAEENSSGVEAQSIEADRKNIDLGIRKVGCGDQCMGGNVRHIAVNIINRYDRTAALSAATGATG